jgi:PAS domain S-box-containing protein
MYDLDTAYQRIVGGAGARSALITDAQAPDNPIVFVTDVFLAMTGYSRDEVLGRNCRFLQGPETDPAAVRDIRLAVAEGRALTRDILNYRKDGTPFWNRLGLKPMFDGEGRLTRFVGLQTEIQPHEVFDGAHDGIQA